MREQVHQRQRLEGVAPPHQQPDVTTGCGCITADEHHPGGTRVLHLAHAGLAQARPGDGQLRPAGMLRRPAALHAALTSGGDSMKRSRAACTNICRATL